MKIDARRVASVLQDFSRFRVFLIYGENAGLVRERATRLVKRVTNSLDDPFLVSVLGKDSHDHLIEEATALSLMGGQRVVWVREASDSLTKSLKDFSDVYLDGEKSTSLDSIVILEAEALSPRSSLRTLVEKHPLMAAIPCYAEAGRSLEETVRALLGRKNITPDAFCYLLAVLGADRALIRNEVEKLLLFVGNDPQITIEDVEQVLGDSHEYSVDDIVYAVMGGQLAVADRVLDRGLKEGISLIAILRGVLSCAARLMQVRTMIEEENISSRNAVAKLNPPVFFKRMDSFMQALAYWNARRLSCLIQQIQHLEYLSKQTAVPAEILCRHFMMVLAYQVKEKKTVINLDSLFSNL